MPLKRRPCAGAFALSILSLACAPQATVYRYDRDQLAQRLASPATPSNTPAGLLIGEFALARPSVIDGDTLKVEGIDGTLRLLGIDSEETFKHDKERRDYAQGFDRYLAEHQAGHQRPVKVATPLGMEAKHWAEEFFAGVRTVRLERDHPKELRGRYGRMLAYAIVERDGRTLNYNIESVRAGMSPYFSKYGYSRRFHDQFVDAQAEARAAGRGIWNPNKEHYRDYDLRLRWWNARADVIARFEQQAQGRDNWIALTHWDALERLTALEGHEVVVLAAIGEVYPFEGKRPARVMLSRRMFSDVPLIFFDPSVLTTSDVEKARGEFVQVTGTVSRYTFAHSGAKRSRRPSSPASELQIKIKAPDQIAFIDTRPTNLALGTVSKRAPRLPAPSPPAEVPPTTLANEGTDPGDPAAGPSLTTQPGDPTSTVPH